MPSQIQAAVRRLLGQQSIGVFGDANTGQQQVQVGAAQGDPMLGQNVFGQQYAASIAGDHSNTSGLEADALRNLSEKEAQAQQEALALQSRNAYALAQLDGDNKARAAGISAEIQHRLPGTSNYITGLFNEDPVVQMADRGLQIQKTGSGIFADVAKGTKDFHESGVRIAPEAVDNRITLPTDTKVTPSSNFAPSGYNPDEINTETKNANDFAVEQQQAAASMTAAQRPQAGGGGADVATYLFGPTGQSMGVQIKHKGPGAPAVPGQPAPLVGSSDYSANPQYQAAVAAERAKHPNVSIGLIEARVKSQLGVQ